MEIDNLGEEEKKKRQLFAELTRLLIRKNEALITMALTNAGKFQGDSLESTIACIKTQVFDQLLGALEAFQLDEGRQK